MNDKVQVFLATPLSEDYQPVREAIINVLLDNNFEPLSSEFETGVTTVESVLKAINQADLVIADVTNSNPNVMYEVGYAYGLKRPVLLAAQRSSAKLPADLTGQFYLIYDKNNLEELRHRLQSSLKRYLIQLQKNYSNASN